MGLLQSDDGHPTTHESVDVEVEIRTRNHKGDVITTQFFIFDKCHMAVHRPVVRSADGDLCPSEEQILILHGNGQFAKKDMSRERSKTD